MVKEIGTRPDVIRRLKSIFVREDADEGEVGNHQRHKQDGEVETGGTGGKATAALMAVYSRNTTVRLPIRPLQADAGKSESQDGEDGMKKLPSRN